MTDDNYFDTADLRGADLLEAKLQGADLRDAELQVGDNPILRAFATNPVGAADMLAALGGPGPVFDHASWESSSDESKHAANVDATDEQVAHARKVLAVIAKEENA